jgi:hypothetical protein
MTTLPLLYTAANGQTEMHNYDADELAEVFGPEAYTQIIAQGVAFTADGGIWVDMMRAAQQRTERARMARDEAARAARRRAAARTASAKIRQGAR